MEGRNVEPRETQLFLLRLGDEGGGFDPAFRDSNQLPRLSGPYGLFDRIPCRNQRRADALRAVDALLSALRTQMRRDHEELLVGIWTGGDV